MTTTTDTMLDQVEERLAMLWFQMDRIGNSRFQEEIERVSDAFPVPEDSPSTLQVVRQAHDLFERVHAEYVPEIQSRIGHQLVGCPHCKPPGPDSGRAA